MINPRVNSLTKSTTLKITALTKKLKKEGKDVVNFAAGEPDFDTPDFAKTAAKKAIDDGFTKYTPSAGIPELREAIAKKFQDENGIKYEPSEIIVTSGAKYAIFVALCALVGKDEEVIIPSPYWVSYPQMVKMTEGKAKFLSTKVENNFKIDANQLKDALTSKTKVLILNYPSNPTGITYNDDELTAIHNAIKDHNVVVISDEIYEKLIYDGRKHTSFASLKGASDLTVTINGFSKAFAMTGWRAGYLAARQQIIDQVSKIIDHTTSCICSISQRAALAAIQDKDWQSKLKKEFENRRDLLYAGLVKEEKVSPFKSEGTFYMFCDIRNTGLSSFDFSSKLLQEQLVSCIPADAFGAEGFVRFSFATSVTQIEKGIERIKNFLKNL